MVKVKRLLRFVCVFFLVMGLASPVYGQYVLDLNVPLYGQEEDNWSGPASGQMTMDGYPNPDDCIYYLQGLIWYIIQGNNLPDEPSEWDTDPQGLRQTLLDLNPPTTGTWSLLTDTVREDLMFDILYWMNRQEYPTPTLVYEGAHWVVIKGFETDIEPVYGSDPVLQTITIHDPSPTGSGATSTMSGTVWYDDYWYGPVNAPGTWFGEYVAIVEPPEAQGAVQTEFQIRSGNIDAIISPEQALAYALYWIQHLNLSAKDPSYISLADTGLQALDPILVREELQPDVKMVRLVPYYYILPFAKGDDAAKGLIRVCVIVNAFTGEFEEVSSFGNPISYLEERKAIDAAARALKIEVVNIKETQATVVFSPCDITFLRAWPFWRVAINSKIVYVDMNGTAHFTLHGVPITYGK